ncbi:hypothetical protein [Enterovirga aerilata]|uniref:Uncharacterized protein n=1 Tax=Enterovirga aerilata TaxID=2730920 RepID=A0A849I8F7_9HYPH|nr:hypothetical protein [Enterovirga sp. DB1703]NNM73678.1 hypothetical protein [Enterovirga sp. DB1703]
MNEAEKHYSGQGGGTGASGSGSGTAKRESGEDSVLGQAASTAREGLKGAADTARSATEAARQTAGEFYGRASRTVDDARRRSAAELSRRRRGVEAFVEENPVMVGVVGFAAGLLIGSLLPATRRENQIFGRYADEVRDQGLRYARELAEQGKSMVEENLQAVGGQADDRDTGDESRAA